VYEEVDKSGEVVVHFEQNPIKQF